jgi:hypothetical protein
MCPFVYNECTEKTIRKEQGRVYVGVWAQHTPPHIQVLLSQLTFLQWILFLDFQNTRLLPSNLIHQGYTQVPYDRDIKNLDILRCYEPQSLSVPF